jgi:ClpP class serine protease
MTVQRFAPAGALALDPRAFGQTFDVVRPDPVPVESDAVAIVTIRGPLMHHSHPFFDSYEEITRRVSMAVAARPRAVVLSIDSPGGAVAGCFETSRALRQIAADAGVPLAAYVDGHATSAAYALACAAEQIVVPGSGFVGSVGIIDTMVDASSQDEALGLKVAIVTSGARKADGNPHVPMSSEALVAAQARVNSLAELFFALVEDTRPLVAGEARALEAALYHGADAVDVGLADQVMSLDELLASLSATEATQDQTKENDMASKPMEDARAALRKAAESDDEEEAKKAKAALAAMDDADEEEAESDEDDAEASASASEGDSDDEEEGASASATPTVLSLAAELHTLKAEREAEKRQAERSRLLAQRPDFDKKTLAALAKAPIETVRQLVETLPKRDLSALAASDTPDVTQGGGEGDGSDRLPAADAAELDRLMGLSASSTGVVNEPHKMVLGAHVRSTETEVSHG